MYIYSRHIHVNAALDLANPNTKHMYSICTMLASVEYVLQMLYKCFMFPGIAQKTLDQGELYYIPVHGVTPEACTILLVSK